MLFKAIEEKDFLDIAQIQSKTEYNGSEYSLLYLKGWDFFNFQSMQITREDGVIFIRFIAHGKYDGEDGNNGYIYLPPLCVLDKIVGAYEKIYAQCVADGENMYVMSTPSEYVDLLGEGYDYVDNEDYSEYLYDPDSLMTYAGKKLHSKRNHVNSFMRAYKPDEEGGCKFRAYTPEDKDDVLSFVSGWEENKEFEDKEYDDMANDEFGVITLALQLVEKSDNYFADVIEYQKKIIGFSLGEITPSGVGITHIEKGDINYDGVYSYLCQAFAKKHFSRVRLINRQEDMGLEGLRKSKLSYRPIGFCKKIVVKKACADNTLTCNKS